MAFRLIVPYCFSESQIRFWCWYCCYLGRIPRVDCEMDVSGSKLFSASSSGITGLLGIEESPEIFCCCSF